MAFRSTPQLGPQIEDVFPGLPYWDNIPGHTTPSYELGNPEQGSDGHDYIWVRNGDTALTASARVNLNETTWLATANASGTHMAPPVAVPANAYFHARKFAL